MSIGTCANHKKLHRLEAFVKENAKKDKSCL